MFEINYFKIWILVILYKTIIHKNRFGQVNWVHLLKRNPQKFGLNFYEFYKSFFEIWDLELISRI
jgi:hypothetical protein